MNPQDAFLQAIRSNLDDDTPRLVYADWLDERGDPRGEFIRLQCALAHVPEGPERKHLEARARQLLARHQKEWVAPIRGLVAKWEFQRGFVESVTVSAPDLLARADALFEAAPVQHLTLTKAGKCMTGLAALPYLRQVVTLQLDNNDLDAAAVQTLASSPHVTRLATLALSYNRIGDEGAGALAASPYLGRLTTLNLFDTGRVSCAGSNGVGLSLASIQAVLASPHLPCLTDLDIGGNRLGMSAVAELAASPTLARLTALGLFGNGVGDAGVEALAASPYVAGLKKLVLGRNGIGDAGCRALAASPYLTGLTTLNLWDNQVDTAGAEALQSSANLKRLTNLDLSWNPWQGFATYAQEIVDRYG